MQRISYYRKFSFIFKLVCKAPAATVNFLPLFRQSVTLHPVVVSASGCLYSLYAVHVAVLCACGQHRWLWQFVSRLFLSPLPLWVRLRPQFTACFPIHPRAACQVRGERDIVRATRLLFSLPRRLSRCDIHIHIHTYTYTYTYIYIYIYTHTHITFISFFIINHLNT